MPDSSLQGTHKPDIGIQHGTVKDGGCGGKDGCGADNISPGNISKGGGK
jgi:hypothetical protein